MREEKEQSQAPGISFKPKLCHAHAHQDNSCFHVHNTAEILHQRLDSLNLLVRRRSSFAIERVVRISEEVESQSFQQNPASNEVDTESDDLTSKVHVLAHRDPKSVLDTDASKRLEHIFDRYMSEHKEDSDAPTKKSKKRKGLNRIQVKRGERLKKSILTLQNQLQKNSSRYLSRSANSLRFQSTSVVDDEFPIPVSESEMDPNLLLTLSCEMLAIDTGRRLLKAVVLHAISQKLFVLMFWFIHCRFFQVRIFWQQIMFMLLLAVITYSLHVPVEKLES